MKKHHVIIAFLLGALSVVAIGAGTQADAKREEAINRARYEQAMIGRYMPVPVRSDAGLVVIVDTSTGEARMVDNEINLCTEFSDIRTIGQVRRGEGLKRR